MTSKNNTWVLFFNKKSVQTLILCFIFSWVLWLHNYSNSKNSNFDNSSYKQKIKDNFSKRYKYLKKKRWGLINICNFFFFKNVKFYDYNKFKNIIVFRKFLIFFNEIKILQKKGLFISMIPTHIFFNYTLVFEI